MAIAIHNKSGIENIFLRNKMRQQIQKGQKSTVNLLKEFLNYWKVIFEHGRHHLIGHDPVSNGKSKDTENFRA